MRGSRCPRPRRSKGYVRVVSGGRENLVGIVENAVDAAALLEHGEHDAQDAGSSSCRGSSNSRKSTLWISLTSVALISDTSRSAYAAPPILANTSRAPASLPFLTSQRGLSGTTNMARKKQEPGDRDRAEHPSPAGGLVPRQQAAVRHVGVAGGQLDLVVFQERQDRLVGRTAVVFLHEVADLLGGDPRSRTWQRRPWQTPPGSRWRTRAKWPPARGCPHGRRNCR